MLRITLLAALAVACSGQDAAEMFNRPPAEVDKALRDRITAFYGYHITGEFRKAESLVAEDTKDYFYSNNKPSYTKCEIRSVKYVEDFKQAKAIVVCGMYLMMPGFTDKPMDVPIGSTWKVEDGKWMWFISEAARRASPFGSMTPGPAADGSSPVSKLPSIPSTADFLYDLVKVDLREVQLKPGGAAQVTVTNTAPGTMKVRLEGKVKGVEAQLDKDSLSANEKAVLTFKAGEGAVSGKLDIYILPIQQLIPIQVIVK